MKTLTCGGCSAPLISITDKCAYCGTVSVPERQHPAQEVIPEPLYKEGERVVGNHMTFDDPMVGVIVTGNHNKFKGRLTRCTITGNHNKLVDAVSCRITGNHNKVTGSSNKVMGNHNKIRSP